MLLLKCCLQPFGTCPLHGQCTISILACHGRHVSAAKQTAFEGNKWLQVLVGHLHRWGIPASRVLLDPLMRPHVEYMTSTLFQIHILQDASGTTLAAAAGECPCVCHSRHHGMSHASLAILAHEP